MTRKQIDLYLLKEDILENMRECCDIIPIEEWIRLADLFLLDEDNIKFKELINE